MLYLTKLFAIIGVIALFKFGTTTLFCKGYTIVLWFGTIILVVVGISTVFEGNL